MSTSVDDISIGVFDDGEGYRFYESMLILDCIASRQSKLSVLLDAKRGINWLYNTLVYR